MTKTQREQMAFAISLAVDRAGSVDKLCEIASVGRSSVYRWLNAESTIEIGPAKRIAKYAELELAKLRPDVFSDDPESEDS